MKSIKINTEVSGIIRFTLPFNRYMFGAAARHHLVCKQTNKQTKGVVTEL
jgi:hypothetical protein